MSIKPSWKWDWTDCGVGSATDQVTGVTFWVTAAGWIQPAGLVTLSQDEIQRLAEDLRQALRDRPPPAFEDKSAGASRSGASNAGDKRGSRRSLKPAPQARGKPDFSGFDFSV